MTLYQRRPTPAIAWRFDGQPRSEWPAWVTEYEVSNNMGAAKIGLSSVGTLLVPIRNGNATTGLKGDYLVREGFAKDDAGKVVGGTIRLVSAQEFPLHYEEAPEA